MPKRKGSGRAQPKRAATKLAARKRPSPQPIADEEVFIPVSKSADQAVPDYDVFIPEKPVYRPLATGGLSKDWYPLEQAGKLWRCPYGCPGVRSVIADIEAHSWDCLYWHHEGKDETPF